MVTAERRSHYLARHPDVAVHEGKLRDVVTRPHEVHRNKADADVALFYRRLDSDHYLRAAVRVTGRAGAVKHSVMSLRLARAREVTEGRVRRVWPPQPKA